MTLKNDNIQEDAQYPFPFDIFAIISFICTAFYLYFYAILIKFESFPLHSFQQRVISVAVLEGVDVVARTNLYLYALILTGILALILLYFLERTMDRMLPKNFFKKERFFLGLISLLGTTNLIFGIFTKQTVFLFNIYLILCLVCCILTIIGVKKYLSVKKPQILLMFDDYSVIISIFLIPITGIFVVLVLIGDSFAITPIILFLYYIIFLILLLFLTVFCMNKTNKLINEKFRGCIANSLIILSIYPVSIPLTNEFQYWLSQWAVINPRVLSLGFLIILIFIGIILYKIQISRDSLVFNPSFALVNFSFPALLAAFSLYGKYSYFVTVQPDL